MCLIGVLFHVSSEVVAAYVTSSGHLPGTCLLPQLECKALSSLPLSGYLKFYNISFAAQDFGMLQSSPPAAVLHPGSDRDIASIVSAIHASSSSSKTTIAARGQGHSIHGQSQARDGIVIEMSAIRGIVVNKAELFVDASAGELWVDVLQATLLEGLTPKSFTDYLHLSVGGTLSNAGLSGQAYRWGPQISNVLQLEVVTGKTTLPLRHIVVSH
jgi:cytokinin dehydrogenase